MRILEAREQTAAYLLEVLEVIQIPRVALMLLNREQVVQRNVSLTFASCCFRQLGWWLDIGRASHFRCCWFLTQRLDWFLVLRDIFAQVELYHLNFAFTRWFCLRPVQKMFWCLHHLLLLFRIFLLKLLKWNRIIQAGTVIQYHHVLLSLILLLKAIFPIDTLFALINDWSDLGQSSTAFQLIWPFLILIHRFDMIILISMCSRNLNITFIFFERTLIFPLFAPNLSIRLFQRPFWNQRFQIHLVSLDRVEVFDFAK